MPDREVYIKSGGCCYSQGQATPSPCCLLTRRRGSLLSLEPRTVSGLHMEPQQSVCINENTSEYMREGSKGGRRSVGLSTRKCRQGSSGPKLTWALPTPQTAKNRTSFGEITNPELFNKLLIHLKYFF